MEVSARIVRAHSPSFRAGRSVLVRDRGAAVWIPLGREISPAGGYSIRACATAAHRPGTGQGVTLLNGVIVLDVVYAVGVIALFALIGLLAKAVEKL